MVDLFQSLGWLVQDIALFAEQVQKLKTLKAHLDVCDAKRKVHLHTGQCPEIRLLCPHFAQQEKNLPAAGCYTWMLSKEQPFSCLDIGYTAFRQISLYYVAITYISNYPPDSGLCLQLISEATLGSSQLAVNFSIGHIQKAFFSSLAVITNSAHSLLAEMDHYVA